MVLLIGWIGRIILILFVVRLIVSVFSGGTRRAGAGPGSNRGPKRPGRAGRTEKPVAKLVRDPQCGTYVTETGSVRTSLGGETLHFCSERCRDEFLASPRASAS
jgi:YHS domain-containing protein